MRLLPTLPILLALASCTAPIQPDPGGTAGNLPAEASREGWVHHRHSDSVPTPATSAPTPPPEPTHSASSPRYRSTTLSSIRLKLVSFDSRNHRLTIADQAGGPGSRWPDGRAAGQSLSGLAAINGGFFTPEGTPLGLVIAKGTRSGSWNRSSWVGSGCYFEGRNGRPQIARREKLNPSDSSIQTLLQSGPMLVENGRAVSGLSSDNPRPRSFLAWDGNRRWLIATTSPCTLAELATTLTGASPAGWPVRHALNLDGGRSTELWAAASVDGGPAFERPFFNKPVRNFLVLTERQPKARP